MKSETELKEFAANLKPGDRIKIQEDPTGYVAIVLAIFHQFSDPTNVHDIVVHPLDESCGSVLRGVYEDEIGMKRIANMEAFVGKKHTWIDIHSIVGFDEVPATKRQEIDGSNCKCCKFFVQWASANQPDNTFLCFSCKSNPIRQYY